MVVQPTDGAGALDRLLEGNARFVAGETARSPADAARRAELIQGQAPIAVVLSCSDSRVPVELVFDQEIGEVFSVRVAGNVATHPIVLGSIEFGVAVLGSPLVMVLGHGGCGALVAAFDHLDHGATVPGDIGSVVEAVLPAAHQAATGPPGGRLERGVRENVRRQVSHLATSPAVLAPAVAGGQLLIVGAEYDMASGAVAVTERVTADAGPPGR